MTKHTLLLYSTTDGQTMLICEKILAVLKTRVTIKIASLKEAKTINLKNYVFQNQVIYKKRIL